MGLEEQLGITGKIVLDVLSNHTTTRLIYTFLILLIGFLLAKASTKIIQFLFRASRLSKENNIKLNEEREPFFRILKYLIMSLSIVIALIYLRVEVVENLLLTYELLPSIVSLILVLILGITVIEFVVYLLRVMLSAVGLTEYLELYSRGHVLSGILLIVRVLLYFILLEIFLRMIGIEFTLFSSFLSIGFYIVVFLIVMLSFFGLRDFAENLYAGIYLNSVPMFRVGRYIKYKNYGGEIEDISRVATTIKTGKKVLWVPNKLLTSHELVFEEAKPELKTLGAIRKHFTEQKPSYCGPASAQIVLSVFGYDIDQIRIGELCKTKGGVGTHPDTLIRVVQRLAKRRVKGAWISYEHITDLKQEVNAWLQQGALVIIDYKKNYLFPSAKKAHYSVVLGIQGDELLVIDPSFKTGGVYFVESERVLRGMNTYSPLIKGKRGYIVLAKKGTNAFWRIENKLIYSDMTLYKGLGKHVRDRFSKLTKKASAIKTVFPSNVQKFLNDWDKREKVYRLWKAKKD